LLEGRGWRFGASPVERNGKAFQGNMTFLFAFSSSLVDLSRRISFLSNASFRFIWKRKRKMFSLKSKHFCNIWVLDLIVFGYLHLLCFGFNV
jgi:hypothetical protein